jgi:hypothetical protein
MWTLAPHTAARRAPIRRTYTAPVTDDSNQPPRLPASKPGDSSASGPAARPRQVTLAVGALIVAAVFSVITLLGVLSQRDWLTTQVGKANRSAVASAVSSATKSAAAKTQDVARASASASSSAIKKNPVGGPKLHDQVSSQMNGEVVRTLLLTVILAFLAYGTFRGRHWVRWGVTGFFILATFLNIGVGLLNAVYAVASNGPIVLRVPTLIASLAMIVAVVLVNMRPSVEFFAASRPANAPARRGLFGPRPPLGGSRSPAEPTTQRPQRGPAGSAATTAEAAPTPSRDTDRQRAKKRVAADSAARGAELARTRAKASKSRRTDR